MVDLTTFLFMEVNALTSSKFGSFENAVFVLLGKNLHPGEYALLKHNSIVDSCHIHVSEILVVQCHLDAPWLENKLDKVQEVLVWDIRKALSFWF